MNAKRILTSTLAVVAAIASAYAQPGTIPMTPHLDAPLVATQLVVPDKFQGLIDAGRTLYLPEGWTAKVFYMGGSLNGPRFMTWGPNGDLYVSSPGSSQVLALPDRNHDGVADTAIVAATGVTGHDVRFYNGAMYVAETDRVVKLTDTDADGIYETHTDFITGITDDAVNPTGGHTTRTIVFDSVNQKMYLSIGSSCNVCRDEGRARIEQFNIDGTGGRLYADGVRNAVGMTLHPRTGRLWATNNGNDMQGNDMPAEWVDLVRDGGFYGWPFAHSYQYYNDFTRGADYQALLPITAADSARVRTMVSPAALVQAHSALMAIEFPNSSAFPEAYRRGAFIASRGSWNRSPQTGYKIMYLDFDGDNDTVANTVSDFLTGFLLDSAGNRWARPVGLASDNRGNLYVSSDANTNFVLVISPSAASSVPSDAGASGMTLGAAYPNPSRGETTVRFTLPRPSTISMRVLDLLGNEVLSVARDRQFDAGEGSITFDVKNLSSGTYIYSISDGTTVRTDRMQVVR